VLLTKRQRNAIFEALRARGVDPQSCALRDPLSTWRQFSALIRHGSSLSRFRIKGYSAKPGTYVAFMTVGDTYQGRSSEGEWDTLMAALDTWAREVAYESDTPDLWTELQQVPEILATAQAGGASNKPFAPDEQAEISRRLDEIKNLVREKFDLTDEQLAAIDQRLDDAEEASKRLGRKDWLMMFYGGLVSTFITDAVPPTVIQTVLSTVIHGIAYIFGIGGPPPIIST
jgi:hypothetical protein